MTILVIVLPIAVAIITGIAAWAVQRLTNSGSIDTSDAETLWAEATAMRTAYQHEAEQRRTEGLELRSEIADLRREIMDLRASLANLRVENIALRADASTMREEAIELCRAVVQRDEIAALLLASGLYGQHPDGTQERPDNV